MKPKALVIRTAGTNCDKELAFAFELAGAEPYVVHLNRLVKDHKPVEQADLIGIPGGFSYGDDVAAGRIFADRLRRGLLAPLMDAYRRRVPMIGICNGFQVLVSLGFLPDPAAADPPKQTLSLADNLSGRFIARWVNLRVNQDSPCVWTHGLDERIELPIAHAEGRLVFPSDRALRDLQERGQVVLEYGLDPGTGQPDNPNGSTAAIAGLCDPTGLIFGLMPHPERYTATTHHPRWTRMLAEGTDRTEPAGLLMFRSAVAFAESKPTDRVASDLVRS